MDEQKWTIQRRVELVLGVMSGDLTVEDAARENQLEADEVIAWRDIYVKGLRQGVQSCESGLVNRIGRGVSSVYFKVGGMAVAVCLVLLVSFDVVSEATNCTDGLLCFNPNTPAMANQVNANFKQVKDWTEQKVGTVGSDDVTISGEADFGSSTRQMLNLYSTGYALGVQESTLYARSNDNFAWYMAGAHDNAALSSGGGTALMSLAGSTTHPTLAIGTNDGTIAVSQNFALRDTGDSWLRLRSSPNGSNYGDLAVGAMYVSGNLSADSNTRSNCAWEGYISEENGGNGNICDSGKYAAGISCSGSYCDSVRLYCCEL